jgi:NAD(P)-dependent dehydrogenase (short-subunit alcohol dehydrogenase family)
MSVLASKVAIVTGGTSGIGARTAQLFVAEGARVVVAGRRREEGERLASELGANASFVETDVADESQVKTLIAHALERFGRIDCLLNCAGGPGKLSPIADLDVAHFDALFAVHVRGTVLAIKHVAPIMTKQGSGSIINVASLAGHLAGFSALDYSAAKAAVLHLTRCAAIELGQKNVRVNSISPGPVLTGIFGKGGGLAHSIADRATDRIKVALEQVLPAWQAIPRVGMPDDIAQVALFLASDAASLINGQDIAVDGGMTAGRPATTMNAERAEFARILQAR